MKSFSFEVTRDRYLSLLKFSGLFPLLILFILSLTHFDILKHSKTIYASFIESALWSVLGLIVMYPILKHCACKKRGIYWLTFEIIMTSISFIWMIAPLVIWMIAASFYNSSNLSQILVASLEKKTSTINIYQNVSFFLTILVLESCYGFILSLYLAYALRLRKQNVLFEYKNYLKSKDYKNAFSLIDSSRNFEELKSRYAEINQSFPELHKFIRIKKQRKMKSI